METNEQDMKLQESSTNANQIASQKSFRNSEDLQTKDHSEGPVAKFIENQTARLPSDTFLWAAGASILGSLGFQLMGKRHLGLFVGQWAPTFLLLGVYNKIVKVAGSDQHEKLQSLH